MKATEYEALPHPLTDADNTFMARLLAAVRVNRERAVEVRGELVPVTYRRTPPCR